MSDQGIALADLIDAVRSELQIAADRAATAKLSPLAEAVGARRPRLGEAVIMMTELV